MKKLMLALLSCALMAPAMAADPVKARKDVFEQYKKTVGPMSKVIKGETPFNKDEFAKMAAHLDELAQQPWQYFTPGSDKGKTDAKPEIWSKPAEFKAAIDGHKAEVAKLKQAAANAKSLDDVKPQFGAVMKTCKTCHDSFRKD